MLAAEMLAGAVRPLSVTAVTGQTPDWHPRREEADAASVGSRRVS